MNGMSQPALLYYLCFIEVHQHCFQGVQNNCMWARDSKLSLVHNILYFPGAYSDFSFVWGILKFISMKLLTVFSQ